MTIVVPPKAVIGFLQVQGIALMSKWSPNASLTRLYNFCLLAQSIKITCNSLVVTRLVTNENQYHFAVIISVSNKLFELFNNKKNRKIVQAIVLRTFIYDLIKIKKGRALCACARKHIEGGWLQNIRKKID